MHSLPRLEILYLVVEEELPPLVVLMMAITSKSLAEFGGNRMDPGLEVLSLLPLKKVYVEVHTPDPLDHQEDRIIDFWRKEYAEMVQKSLLNQGT